MDEWWEQYQYGDYTGGDLSWRLILFLMRHDTNG